LSQGKGLVRGNKEKRKSGGGSESELERVR
jgi:hypothetical protein